MAEYSPPSTGSDQSFHSAHDQDEGSDERVGTWGQAKNIGAGGFGVVKLFVNNVTGQKVVLKECRLLNLSREILDRWHLELEILKRLCHPNIVRALNIPEGLEYHQMNRTPFICMEYCDGGDLRQVLRDPENCCGLLETQIRQICRDVNNGIRFLHSQKVIHRDLKPENILVMKNGENGVIYKLTDFGYAKSYDQSSVCTSLVGTMQYVAPEVVKDKRYHSSVDFWSFGVVVFECITGKRPFLHGDPAVAIGWVDLVAKKGHQDIHIYWGDDDTRPVYSSTLPQPHRLSRPFEGHMTSWLQIALQYNQDMRGGRRVATEDAPCLTNMEHILDTQVINCVCTSTGEINSFIITDSTTVDALKRKIHCNTTVNPADQLLIRPDGYMPKDTDLATCCIQDCGVGAIYVFTTSLEPSFKIIRDTNQAVGNLIAYGDDAIHHEDRREVYSQVFFHLREQLSLFDRLHRGHVALMMHIAQQMERIREQQQNLISSYHGTSCLANFVEEMHLSDSDHLRTLHSSSKAIPAAIISRTLKMWESSLTQLQQRIQPLNTLRAEVLQLQQEAKTILSLAEDIQLAHQQNKKAFVEFKLQYVDQALATYQDCKINRGMGTGRMQDVLLAATQSADAIIQERLNGLNFGKQYVAQRDLLKSLSSKNSLLGAIGKDMREINDQRRKDVWELLQREHKTTPFSSLTKMDFPGSEDIVEQSTTPESVGRQVSTQSVGEFGYARQRSSASGSRYSGSKSISSSISSVDLDPVLEASLDRLTRVVSQEENDRVLHKNQQLMTRLTSITDFHRQESVNGFSHQQLARNEAYVANSKTNTPSSPYPAIGGKQQ